MTEVHCNLVHFMMAGLYSASSDDTEVRGNSHTTLMSRYSVKKIRPDLDVTMHLFIHDLLNDAVSS